MLGDNNGDNDDKHDEGATISGCRSLPAGHRVTSEASHESLPGLPPLVGPEAVRPVLSPTEFVRLWTEQSRPLLSFILSSIPNWNEAEEVLQDVGTTAWEKREQFEVGTNFGAWVQQIAKFKTLSHIKRMGRQSPTDVTLVDLLSQESARRTDETDRRHTALAQCVQKLSAKDRQLLQMRYGRNWRAGRIGEAIGRSTGAIYTALHRIHRALQNCVATQLKVAE